MENTTGTEDTRVRSSELVPILNTDTIPESMTDGLGQASLLELDDDELGWILKPQGRNVVEPFHVVLG